MKYYTINYYGTVWGLTVIAGWNETERENADTYMTIMEASNQSNIFSFLTGYLLTFILLPDALV